jgi:glycosyltransferase involved in cell wall biosynthesis
MKITIITVAYNAEQTIESTINSVLSQTYPCIEYIVIDGASSDGTYAIAEKYGDRISKLVCEPDTGTYDAMNKGIAMSTGDIIGFLHADDIYSDDTVISRVIDEFSKAKVDCVFGNLVYVDRYNTDNIIRYYSAGDFSIDRFAYGCMPPHPTFFAKKSIYDKYGVFKTNYKIAADFELLARFLWTNQISYRYIPDVLVKMRMGGISTKNYRSNLILNREILRACAENKIRTNYLKIYMKYFTKVLQLFHRPV